MVVTVHPPDSEPRRSRWSLRLRLGIGAAVLGVMALLASAVLYGGMRDVGQRLDLAVAAERRMARYASLSTRVSTFLVVATEAIQTGLPPGQRQDRLAPVIQDVTRAFDQLNEDLEASVRQAQELGLDQQSRFGTQSLGLARMQALFQRTLQGLQDQGADQAGLRANVDSFASSFDPLLNQAVNTEVIFRNEALRGIEDLRQRLSLWAGVIALAAVLLVALFYFVLIRPQFARLDRLRRAARQIEAEDFALNLPVNRRDEIGLLYAETNRMAQALAARNDAVNAEWARLNETIAARTRDLQAAHDRLAEVDENRRRFFADVSHELRTPLTVILMEAQIGKQGVGEATEAFATIEARAARLNRKIDDLLRIARSDSGQLVLEPRPVALADLTRLVEEEVRAELNSAGMAWQLDPVPDLSVTCDPNWMRQIVVGLIRNAIRHARAGGKVALRCVGQGDRVTLSVIDNGPGIAKADQARVFDRFAQAGHAAEQGFGIGLALSRWVIEEHGGEITLHSPVPSGRAIGDSPGCQISLTLSQAPAAPE